MEAGRGAEIGTAAGGPWVPTRGSVPFPRRPLSAPREGGAGGDPGGPLGSGHRVAVVWGRPLVVHNHRVRVGLLGLRDGALPLGEEQGP